MSAVIVFPLFYCFSLSMMKPGEIFHYPPQILPSNLYLGNYVELFHTIPIFRFLFNSFLISVIITLSKIILDSMAAYSFAFFHFKGRNVLFLFILATYMIPQEAIVVANFLTIAQLKLLDTLTAVVLPNLVSAVGIFIMRQYFLTLPKELKEASMMDGCGSFRFLTRIALPLSKTAVASLAIYEFVVSWNMYMWPLLVTNSVENRTAQVGISMLNFVDAKSYGLSVAGVVMVLLPALAVFMLGKESIVQGMTAGAVKG